MENYVYTFTVYIRGEIKITIMLWLFSWISVDNLVEPDPPNGCGK